MEQFEAYTKVMKLWRNRQPWCEYGWWQSKCFKRLHFISLVLGHCLWDPQVCKKINFALKLDPTTLFIYLKIILIQCF